MERKYEVGVMVSSGLDRLFVAGTANVGRTVVSTPLVDDDDDAAVVTAAMVVAM